MLQPKHSSGESFVSNDFVEVPKALFLMDFCTTKLRCHWQNVGALHARVVRVSTDVACCCHLVMGGWGVGAKNGETAHRSTAKLCGALTACNEECVNIVFNARAAG